MPRVYDNAPEPGPDSDGRLLDALQGVLTSGATGFDACVGYFNVRGWDQLSTLVDALPDRVDRPVARVLIGMQGRGDGKPVPPVDASRANERLRGTVSDLRRQIASGHPSSAIEKSLLHLAEQLRAGRVQIRLHLRHPLHAKIYLCHRTDQVVPVSAYLGSSNLSLAGLGHQGELNVDIVEADATRKLQRWFDARWQDVFTKDVSAELADVLEESWAGPATVSPYDVYLKMAYEFSREARAGLTEFRPPKEFDGVLLDFQVAALQVAARHLHRRGGVLIGDVVGLGKTMVGTALAKLFDDDQSADTLVIAPKNLVPMWEDYLRRYRLRGAEVMSLSKVTRELPALDRRFSIVMIDESHNLRNRERKDYVAIRDYIRDNESRCVLLSATPYNKTLSDIANQLRLFIPEDADLGIRPERAIRDGALTRTAGKPRTLAAFEEGGNVDDWRDLLRLYMVRRTRSFVRDHYAEVDESGRPFLELQGGQRHYFPARTPHTVALELPADDPYRRLLSDRVVDAIDSLVLPRYGLAGYVSAEADLNRVELETVKDLKKAGRRLVGFTKVGFFKRLESSGAVFLLSIERHIIRNLAYLHALRNGLPVPIGHAGLVPELAIETAEDVITAASYELSDLQAAAEQWYDTQQQSQSTTRKWLRPECFTIRLQEHLTADAEILFGILREAGAWRRDQDRKASRLVRLIRNLDTKVLVFTEFADSANYLGKILADAGLSHEVVTGAHPNPTEAAKRFSPGSNGAPKADGTRTGTQVLIATDLMSEGHNLQDASVIVNWDLPWAIIRLVQRAGRVDRIGQEADAIQVHSFVPDEDVERVIRLRERITARLEENAQLVGSDEVFFSEHQSVEADELRRVYAEDTTILEDTDRVEDVDLASYAHQIWQSALTRDPELAARIPRLPLGTATAKWEPASEIVTPGVLVHARTASGHDTLTWVDTAGNIVTESPFAILQAAASPPETPARDRALEHHDLVATALEQIGTSSETAAGRLGSANSIRARVYQVLKTVSDTTEGTLFPDSEAAAVADAVYQHPLREAAQQRLSRQLRIGAHPRDIRDLCVTLHDEDRLVLITHQDPDDAEPQVVCSLGLVPEPEMAPS